jgi:hypothetical protein
MILHIATFVWNEDVTDAQVEAATAALVEMAAQIPSIRSYAAGTNLHLRPGGKDYGVAAILDDAAGLDAYLDHPLHVAVYNEHLGAMIAERAAVQLPLSEGSFS